MERMNFFRGSKKANNLLLSQYESVVMASVSVISRNGHSEIYINNKKVDLSKATVIEKTSEFTVYQPIEDPDTRITITEEGGIMITSHGSTQVISSNTMTPEQKAEFERKMKLLQKKMHRLESRLGNLGNEISDRVQSSLRKALFPLGLY